MRNSKGFTLVELAVVLVIIGIILGAVIKGQDLVDNARAKQFTNNVKSWQIALSAYYDRKGRFPGDTDKNGLIGEDAGDSVNTDITNAKFVNTPLQQFTLGQNTYYVYAGNDAAATPKNILLICTSATCGTAMNEEALKFVESFDTSIDSSADAKTGSVYGITGITTAPSTTTWVTNSTVTKAAAGTDWLTYTTITGMVYVLQ